MTLVSDLCSFLESFAPQSLAAEWDNVGLLVGDRAQKVEHVMTCLTVTPEVAREAIAERVDVLVTHHPLPFKPLKRLTTDEPTGRILLDLIRAGVAIYSPHTAFDSAAEGINQRLAEGLGLSNIAPLEPLGEPNGLGAGRFGNLRSEETFGQFVQRAKQFLHIHAAAVTGHENMPVSRVAVACGSAGEFLDVAARKGCHVLLTGETRLHTCYEAAARGLGLILVGHYASERFGVEALADVLAAQFPQLKVWASLQERDPIVWL